MSYPTPSDIPKHFEPVPPGDDNTMWALVRRHPRGGFAVVVGLVEWDFVPDVEADSDEHYNTLAGAAAFAKTAGFWSIHPEVHQPPSNLQKGLFQ